MNNLANCALSVSAEWRRGAPEAYDNLGMRDCMLMALGMFAPQLAMEMDTLEGAIDHGFQFVGVLHFAAFGQAAAGFAGAEPGGISQRLIGAAQFMDLH